MRLPEPAEVVPSLRGRVDSLQVDSYPLELAYLPVRGLQDVHSTCIRQKRSGYLHLGHLRVG
jgi:hypothetical protein